MTYDETDIGPIDTTEEMQQMVQTSHLCAECIERKAADALRPGLVASGGWCAPSPSLYGLNEMSCYLVESKPYEDFLPRHKKINRKRAIKAFNRWQRHEARVGQVAHGYGTLINAFPEISVRRGGITFDTNAGYTRLTERE